MSYLEGMNKEDFILVCCDECNSLITSISFRGLDNTELTICNNCYENLDESEE